MRQRTIGRDNELMVRMLVVGALLLALYTFFAFVLFAIGLNFIFIIIVAAIMLLIQYFASDKLVLASMRAKTVKPEDGPDARKLHGIVERLAIQAGLPKPKIAIANMAIPNAFATGRNPKNAVVAVTTGIMGRLNDEELTGVLGHELSHIKNRDVTVMTIASFFAMIAAFIVNNFLLILLFGGGGFGRGRNSGIQYLFLVYFAAIIVYFLGTLLLRALGRYRELAADRSGAILTGAPSQLMSALMKIQDSVRSGVYRIPEEDLRRAETGNAFFIIPALKGNSMAALFATHPPLEVRLERLRRMQREMERI
ncbi:MAG: zinc metalloprotease HtpX [Dehalococcoidia bacterium]